jgi:predicted porin
MRKLLMASAAILGATGGMAFAQAPGLPSVPVIANPSQGQLAAPYGAGPAANNNNNAWGTANTPTGSAAAGPLSTIYAPNVDAVPSPGTVVIRINGRVEVDVESSYTSADKGFSAVAEGVSVPNGYKLNPVGIGSYFRLYPAFDGLAANGIRYGASVEIRENFAAGNAASVSGVAGTGTATGPSSNTSSQTLFVRRAFTYLANDKLGIVRFGQTDGVLSLFDNCIFTTQCWDAGIGNFNGGLITGSFGPAATDVPFVWLTQAGADYGNQKIVYLSPQFFGFDFGVQFAPSEGNADQADIGSAGCNQAAPGCIALTSGNDPTRWYNQWAGGLRFQQSFGAIDVKAFGFYETASKADLTTAAYVLPGPTASAQALRYRNLNFYEVGAAVTAFNFTAAADFVGGQMNNQLGMVPKGGAPMSGLVTGLTYANGPWVFGAETGIITQQGAAQLAGISQQHDFEVAFGGNYKVAPGVQLVGEYMYVYRHQGEFDFSNGTVGGIINPATGARLTRDVHGQTFTFATVLTW